MTRGILIIGNESSLFTAVSAEAAKRVESFASVLIPNRFPSLERGNIPTPKQDAVGGAIPLSWNPASSISARTLVLAAENRLGQINDALLVCMPPVVFKTAETLAPEEIEFFANEHIKSWLFLIRELIQYFNRAGSGTLSFIAPEVSFESKSVQADLLGPPTVASFRTFAQCIFTTSASDTFALMGFNAPEAGADGEFAEWLFKAVDERAKKNRGRWLKFSKLKFFR